MNRESYEQMKSESGNWLKVGRAKLLHALIRRHVGMASGLRILEVGAGVGQNVPVLQTFGSVDALEVNPVGIASLREIPDIGRVIDQPIPSSIDDRYDIIVALDVLEHLRDDREAASWIASHLVDDGVLVATVPAYQWLFSDHDVALEHFRRYTRPRLLATLPPALHVEQVGYFVTLLFPLAAMTRVVSKVLGLFRRKRPVDAVAKQSAAVPGLVDSLFQRILDAEVTVIARGASPPFGLSVFLVARKRLPQ